MCVAMVSVVGGVAVHSVLWLSSTMRLKGTWFVATVGSGAGVMVSARGVMGIVAVAWCLFCVSTACFVAVSGSVVVPSVVASVVWLVTSFKSVE